MPKIEIEISYLDQLRNELEEAQRKNNELQEAIVYQNDKELRKKAITLSYRLFREYIKAVFEKLGFEVSDNHFDQTVVFADYLEQELGKKWWDNERLKANISVHVSDEFRKAFLKIGYVAKPEEEEKPEDEIFNL